MQKNSVYCKKNVPKLFEIATNTFVDALISALETIHEEIDDEAGALSEIENYLNALDATAPARQSLLDEIFCHGSLPHALAVEVLFDVTFKVFRPIDCGDDNARMLKAIATKGAALESLDLSELYLDDSDEYIFELVLQKNPNLKEIKLPRSPEFDAWLPWLSNHCTKLLHLTTPSLYCLSGIATASFKNTIQTISLHDYDDLDREENFGELAPLLHTCPNLFSIFPDINIISIVRNCIRSNPSFSCGLQILNIGDSNEALLHQIVTACPKLVNITLKAPTDGSLAILSRLPLQCLAISDYDFHEVLQLIYNIKHSLKILRLKSTEQNSTVNAYELLKCCPNLRKLKLVGGDARCGKTFQFPQKLQKFHMCNCRWSNPELVNFLSGLQNLQEFYANEVFFTDEDMERVFGQCSFVHFKKFFAEKALKLTIQSVYILLHYCPKLICIGQISKWNVHRAELKSIGALHRAHDRTHWEMWSELHYG